MTLSEWTVTFSTNAREQAVQIESWWAEERRAAPHRFRDELDSACRRLALAPKAGPEILGANGCRVRRTILRRSGYHLYYQLDEKDHYVWILSVWHARRGRGPSFVRDRGPLMAWRGSQRPGIHRSSPVALCRPDALPWRPAAPGLPETELACAFHLLAGMPRIGQDAREPLGAAFELAD